MSPTRISILAAIVVALAAAPATAAAPPSAAATVNSNGTLAHGIGVSGVDHLDTGVYVVEFTNSNIPTACAFTASAGGAPGQDLGANLVNVGSANIPGTVSGGVIVYTYDARTRAPADLPFNIYVAC